MTQKSKKYVGTIIKNTGATNPRIMVGVPMTGLLRSEWVLARYGQIVPCNWATMEYTAWLDQYSPLQFSVPDARNLIVYVCVRNNAEWLLFIDHDVVLPPDTLLKLNDYMISKEYPIVNGLYFTKSRPADPLVYRGRGNSSYRNWKIGDKVMADGAGLGCTLIHGSIIKKIHEESPAYTVQGRDIRKVFSNPTVSKFDENTGAWSTLTGTEDLSFYTRLKTEKIYDKAGWDKFQKEKYPLLIDTSIFCKHIDQSGIQYPLPEDEIIYRKK